MGQILPPPAENAPESLLRGRTYALLGALLAGPPEPRTLALLQRQEPDGARDLGRRPSARSAPLAAAWAALRLAAARTEPHAVAEEYHDLFIGLGRGELVPYGSWYLTGYLMEQPLARLRRDLERLGFERQQQVKEPEDHVAALCEVMGALCVAPGGDQALEEQRRFFATHLAPWLGRFFQDLQEASSARFYRSVGSLGEHFFNLEKTYLSMAI